MGCHMSLQQLCSTSNRDLFPIEKSFRNEPCLKLVIKQLPIIQISTVHPIELPLPILCKYFDTIPSTINYSIKSINPLQKRISYVQLRVVAGYSGGIWGQN